MANLSNIAVFGTDQILIPSAYSIESIMLCNHNGRITDIQKIVTDFSITESIYYPGLMLSLNVKDTVNLMEEFQLTGHETITVNLARKTYVSNNDSSSIKNIKIDNQKLSHLFYVSEYPLYGKFENRVQVYTLKGVSKHIFMSKFKRISRAYAGNIKNFVKEVLMNDLGVPSYDIEMTNENTNIVKFVVPNLSPIDAIQWALRRAYDSHGSPFYCYETLGGKIKIDSHTDFNKRSTSDVYREYKEGKFFSYGPGTLEDYNERRSRIMDLSSDIRMSKLISGSNGAYASKSVYVDIATKSIATTEFDYNKEFSKMSKIGNFSTLSQRFTPDDIKESKSYSDDRSFWQRAENIKAGGGKSLSDFKNSMINYISLNTAAFSYAAGNTPNYHGPTQSSKINIAQSVTENLETMIHDFNVAGDFELNSGKIILLNIAPSEDPTAIKKNSKLGKSPTPGVDQFFSGNYVVTSVIHNFSEDYFASVRVKTDSFSNDFLTK
jgi:hypothetical protein